MYVNKRVQGKRISSNPRQLTPRQVLPTQAKICRRCGQSSHSRQVCPATNATCFRCNRKGHYSSQCLSKTMAELTTPSYQDSNTFNDDPYSNTVYTIYLDTVGNGNTSQWNVTVLVGNNPVLFKVNTGAEVTALSEETFHTFLKPSSTASEITTDTT